MNEDDVPPWDYIKIYKKGDKVYYFYDLYIARCDTQGHPEDGDWYDPTEEDEHGRQIS